MDATLRPRPAPRRAVGVEGAATLAGAMGRASSSKKVARAARAGGRPGASRNFLWPAVITALVLVGVLLVVISRPERVASAAPIVGDHWHAAYGVSVCGEFQAPYGDAQQDTSGIHAHGEGLIHMHPFSSNFTGDGANLEAFAEQVGMVLEDERLELPDGGVYENGDDCEDGVGRVQVQVWDDATDEEGRLLDADFADYAPQDGEVVTIAFAPEGAELAKPPSVGTIPTDLGGQPPASDSDDTVPVESSSSSAPTDSSATTSTPPTTGTDDTTGTSTP